MNPVRSCGDGCFATHAPRPTSYVLRLKSYVPRSTFHVPRSSSHVLRLTSYILLFTLYALRSTPVCAAEAAPGAAKPPSSYPDSKLALSPDASSLEEGKALYENGQLIAALGKFMGVLRNDPHNPEARQYLRMIVDTMRQNPAISASKMGQEQALATNPAVQEEIRRMLQLRSRLSLDLKAIPSVEVNIDKNVNQVIIKTSLLFADQSGGLKEQGVPVLDRVAAWLKTYGQQPVIIHCYPEEFAEPSTNGSLFLHRYSELFNFFVEEKKLAAQRFVSADLLKTGSEGAGGEASAGSNVALSTDAARVVIETIGTQTAMLDSLPSMTSTKGMSQWLENSIMPNRRDFNPEDGEWVSLDLAALTRAGLRSWTFKILPAAPSNAQPIYQISGNANLLKRLSWDGHDQKTGDFVNAGSYIAKLVAVNSDGTIKTLQEILRVERTTKSEPPVLANKPKPKAKKNAIAKKPVAKAPKPVQIVQAKPAKVPSPPEGEGVDGGEKTAKANPPPPSSPSRGEDKSGVVNSDSLIDTAPAEQPPAAPSPTPSSAETAPTIEDNTDSAHTIWKQVIQFDANQSDLVPTVKSSLERIAKTLEVYPLQKVRITGFAAASEQHALELAKKRAEAVRSILVNDYSVDKKRVIVAGGKISASENGSKVEMSITN